ncbi:MAG: HipA domain-containing protein [Thermodesulfobacteriota bacterium]|nr:HipA domain-containing protein [Thermodesulfobacteriota bacterium]
MNNQCLSCQTAETDLKLTGGYHPRCSRKLFGTASPPKVPFGTPDIAVEAQKMVGRMSISGIQPKLSLIHERKNHQLTVIEIGGSYILKPQTERFESLPENENLCMCIASSYGIAVPSHGLIPLSDGRLAYLVKQFDRLEDESKLQQEDFQQLLQTNDKYKGSYEQIANVIRKYSNVPGLDLVELFERALLNYVVGNGDAHLKNFSLIKEENIGYHLSPVYDLVNSRLVLPEEREEMCLSLQGKKNRLSRKDFMKLAENFGLTNKQSANSMDRLNDIKPVFENMMEESFLNERLRDRFLEIYRKRMERIFG